MIPVSSLSGGLLWSRTSHILQELRRNGEIVGSLRRTSFCSSEFQADPGCGKWKFLRTGCFNNGAQIVDANSGQQVATFKQNWAGSGALTFPDGQIFRLTSEGIWRRVWSVSDNRRMVLRIHSREKSVELPNESQLPEDRLVLLSMFAWYIMQQASEDDGTIAAMVAVTS